MVINKSIKYLLLLLAFIVLIFLYYSINPSSSQWFPKCPFYMTIGYKCPGCGSQRTAHALLNFDIVGAFKQNALLVLSIPYVILGLIFEYAEIEIPNKEKWRQRLFGVKAIWIVFTVIVVFWLFRNIYNF